ncbi:hypothetical protein, partial [Fibrella forsythiae]
RKVGRSTADLAFVGNILAQQGVKPAVKQAKNALFSPIFGPSLSAGKAALYGQQPANCSNRVSNQG